MARRLGPEQFGLVTLGGTLVVWFTLIVDAGTETIGVRDVSREPHRFRQLTEPVLGLRLLLAAVAVLAFVPAILIATDGGDRRTLLLFALVLPAVALNPRWMVLGVDGSRAVAAGNIASQLAFAGGVVLLVDSAAAVSHVPMLQALGELAYALVVIAAVAPQAGFLRPRIDLAAWRATLRASLPLFGNSVARAAVYFSSIVFIAGLLGRREVGLFGAAYKPTLLFSTALILFFQSFLSSYSAAATSGARALFVRTARVTVVATVSVAAVLTVTSSLVVDVFYGDAYRAAVATLAVLGWTIPLLALTGLYASALIAGDRQAVLMRVNVIVAAFTISATLAVLPVAGIEGAAAVIVASHLLAFALTYRAATSLGLAPLLPALLGRTTPGE